MSATVGDVRTNVSLVVGTCPEAVKVPPVVRALDESGWAQPVVITTGQHGEVVREVFDLKISYELGVVRDEAAVAELLTAPAAQAAINGGPNPYGDGQAGHRVVETGAWPLGRGHRPAGIAG